MVVGVGAVPVSGLTQPAAGPASPCAGHERGAGAAEVGEGRRQRDVPPSVKLVVEMACRMKPLASMSTTTVCPCTYGQHTDGRADRGGLFGRGAATGGELPGITVTS